MSDFEEQNDEHILHTDRGDIVYQAINLEGEQQLELMAKEILESLKAVDEIVEKMTGIRINPPDIFLFNPDDLSAIAHHKKEDLAKTYYFITDGSIFINTSYFLSAFEGKSKFNETAKTTLIVNLVSHLIEHYALTSEHFETNINATITHSWEVQCLRTIYEVSEERYRKIQEKFLADDEEKYKPAIYKVTSVEPNTISSPNQNLEDAMPYEIFQSNILNFLCTGVVIEEYLKHNPGLLPKFNELAFRYDNVVLFINGISKRLRNNDIDLATLFYTFLPAERLKLLEEIELSKKEKAIDAEFLKTADVQTANKIKRKVYLCDWEGLIRTAIDSNPPKQVSSVAISIITAMAFQLSTYNIVYSRNPRES